MEGLRSKAQISTPRRDLLSDYETADEAFREGQGDAFALGDGAHGGARTKTTTTRDGGEEGSLPFEEDQHGSREGGIVQQQDTDQRITWEDHQEELIFGNAEADAGRPERQPPPIRRQRLQDVMLQNDRRREGVRFRGTQRVGDRNVGLKAAGDFPNQGSDQSPPGDGRGPRLPRPREVRGALRTRRPRDTSSDDSGSRHRPSRARLPPFTGKETWEVWMNRFEDVADRRGWSTHRRLDELLPLLQGAAGDFVYGQLDNRVRRDYDSLTLELWHRYRTIEQRKTMGAKFSHRVQGAQETTQEFAADLKRLYDKAHPHRDRQTRAEDLLRRFLDGLKDETASFHVEYVKEPLDIDEAVNEVINFAETRGRPDGTTDSKRPRRVMRAAWEDSDEEVEERVARQYGRPTSTREVTRPSPREGRNAQCPATTEGEPPEVARLQQQLVQAQERLTALEGQLNRMNPSRTTDAMGQRLCFRCGQPGHFARGCVNPPQDRRQANSTLRSAGNQPGGDRHHTSGQGNPEGN